MIIKYVPLRSALLITTISLTGCGGSSPNTDSDFNAVDATQPVSDWQLVWSDEFDDTRIDSEKWEHEINCDGGGNNEAQCYTDASENAYVADGLLNIVAIADTSTEETTYTSARLVTRNTADFTYGRIEMRAKLPSGQGAWPAFWMMPTNSEYGDWPRSGEIDIVEAVNLKTVTDEQAAENRIYGTLHYGRVWPDNSHTDASYQFPNNVNPADDFHTYAVEWQEGEIRWYADDYLYATQRASDVRYNANGDADGLYHKGWFSEYFGTLSGELEVFWDNSPFDKDFFLILNLAVGGDWAGQVNNTGIDVTAFENGQAYQIDYVRVYECSTNPDTGKGCETVRAGYDDTEDALLIGEAPIPAAPSSGEPVPLTIFADATNPYWPLWDCCGNTTPAVVIDDDAHGAVAEFAIGDAPTVMGFITKLVDDTPAADGAVVFAPKPFDASSMLTNGKITFDMKVVTAPTNTASTWVFKVESNDGADNDGEAVELALTQSVEGIAPITGEWQTYSFTLESLSTAGLDITAIDVLMIFPTWDTGSGALYRVDNVEITQDFPELVLFEDAENTNWPAWDCCGGSTPSTVIDDATHGAAMQFTVGATPTVMGFQANSDISFDASNIVNGGAVQFDMKVVTAPNNPDSTWVFKIESGGATTFVEIDIDDSVEGVEPVVGEWQTYTFLLTDLADLGLDVSAIDVVMIFPAWDTGDGAEYLVDNAKIYYDQPETLNLFDENTPANWSLWDCCAGSTPAVVIDEDVERGNVAEFSLGATETVVGFLADDNHYFDASSASISGGYIRFDMKVVSAPSDTSALWNFKVESGDASQAISFTLDQSVEGVTPVTGVWQTYTFPLDSLTDPTDDKDDLELALIDIVMIFPDWGKGNGTVFRIDNAKITFE